MLFISRNVGTDKYGVVDTDDNVEEVLTWSELVHAVLDCGLEIAGAPRGMVGGTPVVAKAVPYQHESYATPLMSKTSLLRHVDITVWRSMITRVFWRAEEADGPIRIRLSDFGDSCADCMLLDNNISAWGNRVTLVLDDKITLSDCTFTLRNPNMSAIGAESALRVALDVRDVTRIDTIKMVYRYLSQASIIHYIEDSDERKMQILNVSEAQYRRLVKRWG